MFRKLIFLCFLSLLPPMLEAATPVSAAQLVAARWLEGSAGLDISGLTFCAGELLAVSDKNSTEIYTVAGAALKPHTRIAALAAPEGEPAGLLAALLQIIRPASEMDFEGITCDGGTVYLVSEHHNRIAKLRAGGDANWLVRHWASEARSRGYLTKLNAGTEGLVKIDEDFWIAMEREPRGLLRLSPGSKPRFFSIPPVAALEFRGRAEDVTGLAHYDGALFTLERNAFAVCRRSLETLEAEWCIDYRAVEEAPEFVYEETKYGKGEGVAVDASGIYVVLDNNNVARAADSEDKRALLLHLGFPLGALATSSASGPQARPDEPPQR